MCCYWKTVTVTQTHVGPHMTPPSLLLFIFLEQHTPSCFLSLYHIKPCYKVFLSLSVTHTVPSFSFHISVSLSQRPPPPPRSLKRSGSSDYHDTLNQQTSCWERSASSQTHVAERVRARRLIRAGTDRQHCVLLNSSKSSLLESCSKQSAVIGLRGLKGFQRVSETIRLLFSTSRRVLKARLRAFRALGVWINIVWE